MRCSPNKKRWIVLLAAILVPVVGGCVYYFESIPARHWNETALAQVAGVARQKSDSITFAVFGDSKGNLKGYDRLLDAVSRDPEISFAIHLGDMVGGGEDQSFRKFLRHTRAHFTRPLLTLMGNHDEGEGGRELYDTIFAPAYYSFTLGQTYCMVLDDGMKGSLDEKQLGWLEGELKNARNYPNRLVFMHKPPFDPRPGEAHCLPKKEAKPLMNLFWKYPVTHLFAGHIHSYYEGEREGIHYVITGGAGSNLEGKNPAHDFFHYMRVTLKKGEPPAVTLCKLP